MDALDREIVLAKTRIHDGELVSPVESLERYFGNGGTTILRAAFEHSFSSTRNESGRTLPSIRIERDSAANTIPGLTGAPTPCGRGGKSGSATTRSPSRPGRAIPDAGSIVRRLRRPACLGPPSGSRGVHRRMEPLLHALLGPDADRTAASSSGTGDGDHARGLSRAGSYMEDVRFQKVIAGASLNGDVYALRSGQRSWRQGIVSRSMECQTGRGEPPVMVPHA